MPAPLKLQPPRTLRGGLASVSDDLSALMPASEWRTGVQYTTKCSTDSFIWGCEGGANESLDTGEFDTEKTETATAAPHDVDFYPGMIGSTTECMVAGRQTVIGDLVRQSAEQSLDRVRYSTLAQILYYGNVGRTDRNASLQGDATVPDGFDPSAPSGIKQTLQGLLDATSRCWDQQLVFHVPAQYLPYFLADALVEFDQSAGVYRMGAHLVSFDTYVNLGPNALIGGSGGFDPEEDDPALDPRLASADGSDFWIYATSTPLIGLDAVDVQSSILDPRLNKYRVVAEQGAIILFDPCCAIGAKAAVCPVAPVS